MKEKKDKNKIIFRKFVGRIQADAMDTYYWLALQDQKIANKFLKKYNHVEEVFNKEDKLRNEILETNKETGNMAFDINYEVEQVKKPWYKRLF